MKYIIGIIILFFSLMCNAAIYMHEEKDNTVYSDTPLSSDASKVILKKQEQYVSPPNTSEPIISINNAELDKTSTTTDEGIVAYTQFEIVSPKDQATIQNQPTIPVTIKIDPELKSDDKIQLYIDGVPVGEPQKSVNLMLPQIVRGTHKLSAAVLDNTGFVLKQSNAITIYVHQASVTTILLPKG